MTSLSKLDLKALEKQSLKEYFQAIETTLTADHTADELTDLFTCNEYSETRPYLTRRKLVPRDIRFDQIEIVYENPNKVKAIVFYFKVFLSQLVDIFGQPIIHDEPYSDSTAFGFKSDNSNIGIINTRHPKWLTEQKDRNGFTYQEGNHNIKLVDPEFSFVQFNIAS